MRYVPGRDDVIIQTVAASRRGRESDEQLYDALIYTNLPVDATPPQSERYRDSLRTLPLRGVERIRIPDRAFGTWLASFIEGEKGLDMMRHKMLDMMSDRLRSILTVAPLRMRIWWSNVTPELDELPWELAVEAGRRHGEHSVALLRGVPPETPIPPLPLAEKPKLGMIGPVNTWPDWAHALASRMAHSVIVLEGSVRSALEDAAARGIELVHVFCDGVVSGALDGLLYDHSVAEERGRLIATTELSRILTGSRVVLMSLSPADSPRPETVEIGSRSVLSAYRAFKHIGTSSRQLPSILAPLGPVPAHMMSDFWGAFYAELATNWHLAEALRNAQSKFPYSVPIALFSRHAGGKLFQAPRITTGEHDPMQARASLLRSQQLTSQLSQIKAKYDQDLPESVKRLIDRESGLQSQLRGELEDLSDTDGEA